MSTEEVGDSVVEELSNLNELRFHLPRKPNINQKSCKEL